MTPILSEPAVFPSWVPDSARHYLWHTEAGHSIRALARNAGCHASTVLRQVRKLENRREDMLIDEALTHLGALHRDKTQAPEQKSTHQSGPDICTDEATINKEARRILRRLSESGAMLAVAKEMEKAVVVRTAADNSTTRTATVDRPVAYAMALKDWISVKSSGRITRYEITATGRNALKDLLDRYSRELAEAQTPFTPREHGTTLLVPKDPQTRYTVGETTLVSLSRRKDKSGTPFLSEDLVIVGERLREDFELAQIDTRTIKSWEALVAGQIDAPQSDGCPARQRVADALQDLGPGLADVVLRTCCFLEGLETAEKRMGWSARSGKIVLRIALQRLKRHYDERYGKHGPMIG
ncbi:DUF6456 domain-containing protein [Nereida sp. MMG025]|uniref:DUF6456 domain-containing protein n=1 Tax=Nereida sp. MMG025 TaxID=2909981 RepID=UPI001F1AC112|nr:DUF6456 domain-containing protein [Nereida sp. MMG025]MCF6443260.1 DUF6456 domain-containing protein [Nereida sp. MMG025]